MKVGLAVTMAATVLAGSCAHESSVAPRTSGAAAPAASPLTPADLQAHMKTIQGALDAVHMKLAENRTKDAAIDAQTLASTFGNVERFWSQHHRQDALTWARQARTDAAQMAAAAAAGDAEKTAAAATHLSSACQQCHAAYRDGSPESGFHIRPGVL
jgi:hypothetical protein